MLQTSNMATDIQLRVPTAHPHMEHQHTMLVTDDQLDSAISSFDGQLPSRLSDTSPETSLPTELIQAATPQIDGQIHITANPLADTQGDLRQTRHNQLLEELDNSAAQSECRNPLTEGLNNPLPQSTDLPLETEPVHSAQDKPHTQHSPLINRATSSSAETENRNPMVDEAITLSIPERDLGPVKYGELVILGYNGSLVNGDRGRKRSKFILSRRSDPNGVKPAKKHLFNSVKDCQVLQSNTDLHSISYTLSRSQHVIVQYELDDNTDMFQIGRSSEDPIDCVVMDTIPGPQRNSPDSQVSQSTISRFSCRICVDRKPPYHARIYAAGFDIKKNIFLGEKATKWYSNNTTDVDGLTTNGVLILHPRGEFNNGECEPGIWREVSVGGGIYNLRETRSIPSKNQIISSESNILRDGTLIDLCGATLVWRSANGLESSPTGKLLESWIEQINASRPQCPVGLNTLVLPKRNTTKIEKSQQPFVYLSCGHVHGEHEWGAGTTSQSNRVCPMCFKEGPFVRVQVGNETSLYTDAEPLTHAFTPCTHMASQQTVRYWSSVVIPFGCQGFRAMCPFCATPLTGDTGFIKLIFQDNTEF